MKRHIHILYIGDDVIIRDNHPIKKWQGKVALKSNTHINYQHLGMDMK